MAMAAVPGQSCGPFFASAVFVAHAPAGLKEIADGKLGILWPNWSVRQMAIAYRILNGPGLTAEEKAQVSIEPPKEEYQAVAPVIQRWLDARHAAVGTETKIDSIYLSIPGEWQAYSNCMDDAFDTAVKTLLARQKNHPQAEVTAWVAAQDAVFSNCGNKGELPKLGSATPWLVKDFAYQTAAAHFYRAEWEPAASGFRAIAADTSSPWHDTSAYMVGRVLLRQATLVKEKPDDTALRLARAELEKTARGNGPYAASARGLVRAVNVHLEPASVIIERADDAMKPGPRFAEDLIDLRYLLNDLVNDETETKVKTAARSNELVDWILTTQQDRSGGDAAHAMERWRATKSTAWLMTALEFSSTPQPELIAAAKQIPRNSPAWLTATYHRLRLQDDAAARAELIALLPQLKQSEPVSTANAFQILLLKSAKSLDEYVHLSQMLPAGYEDGDGSPMYAATVLPDGKGPTMAGLPVDGPEAKRLEEESAQVLNNTLPLETLASIAQNNHLDKQLGFELAMAVWTRAVLLDKPEIASSLTPAMIAGEPGWKQWLAAYDNAKTADERKGAALLALMRFPSVRPYVESGAGRPEGFVGYSSYRDNWWCADMSRAETEKVKAPAFVTAAMKSQAQKENMQLGKVGDAPAYFGRETLAWVKAHSSDPNNAEMLAFAFRAMRNGCELEKSYTQRREVFTLLHKQYPRSEWARRFPVFTEEDNN